MRDLGRRNCTVTVSAASFLLSSLDETPSFRSAPSTRVNRKRRSSRRAMRSEHERETTRGSSTEGYKTLPPREIFVKASNSSEKKSDNKMAAAVSDNHSKKLITDSSYQESDQPKSPHPREAGDKETQIFTFDGFTLVSTGDDEMRQEKPQRRTKGITDNDEREEVAAMQTPLYSLNLRGKKPSDSVNEERTVVSQSIQWLLSEQEVEVPFDEEPVSILGSTSYAMSFMPSERSPRHRFGDSFSDESSTVFFKSSSPVHKAPPINGDKVSKTETSIVTSIPPLVPKQEQTSKNKSEESDTLASFYQNMTCLNTDAIEDREESCPYVFHDANSQSSDIEDHNAMSRLRATDGVFKLESPDLPSTTFDEDSISVREEEVDPLFEEEVERLVAECSNEASMEEQGSPSLSARFGRVNVLAGINEDDSVALSEKSSNFEQDIDKVATVEVDSKVLISPGQGGVAKDETQPGTIEAQPATTTEAKEATAVDELSDDRQASIQASNGLANSPIDRFCLAETEGQHCCSSKGKSLSPAKSDNDVQSDILGGGCLALSDRDARGPQGLSASPQTLSDPPSSIHQASDVVVKRDKHRSTITTTRDHLKNIDVAETRSQSPETWESQTASSIPESSMPSAPLHEASEAVTSHQASEAVKNDDHPSSFTIARDHSKSRDVVETRCQSPVTRESQNAWVITENSNFDTNEMKAPVREVVVSEIASLNQASEAVKRDEHPSGPTITRDHLKYRDAMERRSQSPETRDSQNDSAIPDSLTRVVKEMKVAMREVVATAYAVSSAPQVSEVVTLQQASEAVKKDEYPSLTITRDRLKYRDVVGTRCQSPETRELQSASAIPERLSPVVIEMKTTVGEEVEEVAMTSTLPKVKSSSSPVVSSIESTLKSRQSNEAFASAVLRESFHEPIGDELMGSGNVSTANKSTTRGEINRHVTNVTLDRIDNGPSGDSVSLQTESPSGEAILVEYKSRVSNDVDMGDNDPVVSSVSVSTLQRSKSASSQSPESTLFMDTPEEEPGRIRSPKQRISASTDFTKDERRPLSITPHGGPGSWSREKATNDPLSCKSLENKFDYAVKTGSSSLSIGLLARSFSGAKSSDNNEEELGTRTRAIDQSDNLELPVHCSIQPKSLDDNLELKSTENTEKSLDQAASDTLPRGTRKSDELLLQKQKRSVEEKGATDSTTERPKLSATRMGTVHSTKVPRQNSGALDEQTCESAIIESMGDAKQADGIIRGSKSPTEAESIELPKSDYKSNGGPFSFSLGDTHSRSTLLDSARQVIKSIESSMIRNGSPRGLETGNESLNLAKVPTAPPPQPDRFKLGEVKNVAGLHVKRTSFALRKDDFVAESQELARRSPLATAESPLLIPIDSPTDSSRKEGRTSQSSGLALSQPLKPERPLFSSQEEDTGGSVERSLIRTPTHSGDIDTIDGERLQVFLHQIRMKAEGFTDSCDCSTPLATNKAAITYLPDLARSMANTSTGLIESKGLEEILANMNEPDYGESPAVSREEVVTERNYLRTPIAIEGTFSRTDDETRETCRYSASDEFTEDGTMGSRTSSLLPELESKKKGEKKKQSALPSMTSVFDDDEDDDNFGTAPSDEVPINRVESMDYTTGTATTLIFTSSSSGEYVTSLITGTESEAEEGCTGDIMKLNTTELSKLPLEAQKCAADICQMNNCF